MKINKIPKPHQKEAIQLCLQNKKFLVCHDVGQGKSLTMLCVAYLLQKHYDIDGCIVVATNSAIRSLTNEMKNTFNDTPLSLETFQTKAKGIVFITYDEIEKLLDKFPQGRFALFLDEFHKVKDPKTTTTKLSNILKKKCVRRYGFTATPIMKDMKDLYMLIKWLDPMIFSTWKKFCDDYTLYYKMNINGFEILKPYKYKNYEKLKRALKTIVHSYFPKRDISFIKYAIPMEDIEGYRRTRDDALASTGDEKKDRALPMHAVKKCKQFVAVSNGKLQKLKEIVSSIVDTYGVVIYCDEYATFNPVYSYLSKAGFTVLKYAGVSSKKEKDISFEEFTKAPKGKVLLLSRVGGASLNLQATNQLIIFDQPSILGNYVQCVGRCTRMDSKYKKFFIHILVTENSVEDYWYQYITMYKEPLSRVFGNGNIPSGIPSYNEFLKKKMIKDTVWNK